MKQIILFSFLFITWVACRKKNQPEPRICVGSESYFYKDTMLISNCSAHFDHIRWVLPDGTTSTADQIYYIAPAPGLYTFTLFAGNDDFVNEYKTTRTVTVNP